MADQNHWLHSMCRFFTYCRRTWAGGTEPSQDFGEEHLQVDLPRTRLLGLLHGNQEMPNKCRIFLGFVNILAVAIVVGLAMEGASPNDPQVQANEDDNDPAKPSDGQEQDKDTGHHDIQELPAQNPPLSITKVEDVETSKASKPEERAEGTSTASEQCGGVCNYCTALAKKVIRIITQCAHCGGEEHTVHLTGCKNCGGIEENPKATHGDHVNLPSQLEPIHKKGDLEGESQGESKGCPRDLKDSLRPPVQSQVTLYWRNRVLDILAPSLPPLPNLFDDSGNMSETGHDTGGNVGEGDQGHNEVEETMIPITGNGETEHETAHERSHRLQDGGDADNNLETILENEDEIHAAVQRARARTQGRDPLQDDSLRQRTPSPTRVQIHLPASVLSPQPDPRDNFGYPRASTIIATRPATPPGADRNDSHTNALLPLPRSYVFLFNSRLAPTETTLPELNNAPQLDYYGTFTHGENTSNGVLHFSSSDDDEIRSQTSRSPSSRSWSTPIPSSRPRLRAGSIAPRERFGPRARVLARRPKCGLRMMKALRDDPSCTPEEGEVGRQPGREDKLFSPRRGDVICRHTLAPGRGVVEIYFPGIEKHLQDGDTLVRLKMDNVSYPTMLILSVKAYLFLQGRWMYLGRHQHGVRKPKKERLLG